LVTKVPGGSRSAIMMNVFRSNTHGNGCQRKEGPVKGVLKGGGLKGRTKKAEKGKTASDGGMHFSRRGKKGYRIPSKGKRDPTGRRHVPPPAKKRGRKRGGKECCTALQLQISDQNLRG